MYTYQLTRVHIWYIVLMFFFIGDYNNAPLCCRAYFSWFYATRRFVMMLKSSNRINTSGLPSHMRLYMYSIRSFVKCKIRFLLGATNRLSLYICSWLTDTDTTHSVTSEQNFWWLLSISYHIKFNWFAITEVSTLFFFPLYRVSSLSSSNVCCQVKWVVSSRSFEMCKNGFTWTTDHRQSTQESPCSSLQAAFPLFSRPQLHRLPKFRLWNVKGGTPFLVLTSFYSFTVITFNRCPLYNRKFR
jgi:hypothetical protein